jgi:DNA-directed RNA polymerase subunit beta'
VIVRQMLQKVRIVDSGDSSMLENENIDKIKFLDENMELKNQVVVSEPHDSKMKVNQLVDKRVMRTINQEIKKKNKKPATVRNAEPAIAEPILLGITQASLTTESWLSAASFQETTRVLSDASVSAKIDHLIGLKENIILGQLIPAGTGLRTYQDMLIDSQIGNIFGAKKEEPEEELDEDDIPVGKFKFTHS